MAWKKSKRSSKGGKKLKPVAEEAQPKLRSCLKKPEGRTPTTSGQESSQKELYRISPDGSSTKEPGSLKSVASRSLASTNCSRSVESRGSAESGSRNPASVEQMSCTDESSADHGQSSQASERSAQSGFPVNTTKRVRFNAIQIRDYEVSRPDTPLGCRFLSIFYSPWWNVSFVVDHSEL